MTWAPPKKIYAPFSPDQVAALNVWQANSRVHPFTCGSCRATLVATETGWVCPNDTYRQNWAHDFMALQEANAPPL